MVARGEVGLRVQGVPVEFAPAQLGEELRRVLQGRGRQVAVQPLPDLRWGDLAEPQVGGEPRRADRGLVASVVVGESDVGEVLEPALRGGLAGLPGLAQPRCPVRTRRQQLPRVEIVGCHGRPRGQLAGGGQRVAHRALAGGPPERREHLVRLSGARADLPRLDEEVGGERGGLDPVLAQSALEAGIHVAARAVTSVPEHGVGSGLGDERGQHLAGRPAAQDEPPAARRDLGRVRRQGVVQPPAGRAAERADAGALLVEQVQQHHGAAVVEGGAERRVIAEAQIVAEPDDRGHDVSLSAPSERD